MEDILGKSASKCEEKSGEKEKNPQKPTDQSSARDRAGQPAGSGKSGNDLSYR